MNKYFLIYLLLSMNVVLNHMLNWHLSFPVGIDFCMDGENVLTMHKLKVIYLFPSLPWYSRTSSWHRLQPPAAFSQRNKGGLTLSLYHVISQPVVKSRSYICSTVATHDYYNSLTYTWICKLREWKMENFVIHQIDIKFPVCSISSANSCKLREQLH